MYFKVRLAEVSLGNVRSGQSRRIKWLNLLGSKSYMWINSNLLQVDEVVPLLAEGLRAVQKVEDFVDATIGEDCSYECNRQKIPAPKPGHVPSSNGKFNLLAKSKYIKSNKSKISKKLLLSPKKLLVMCN